MVRGNKGEWSEPYVAIRLLAEGKLYLADADGNKNEKRPNGTLFVFQIIRVLTLPNTNYPQYLL